MKVVIDTNVIISDEEDDKFIACALAGECGMIISGDKLLRKISRYKGIRIVTPREFLEEVLHN